jgi:alpha-beta hydrolase superfamily lysophospholipase
MDFIPVTGLAVWRHVPEKKTAKARVLIIHGLSEHSGRHLNTVNALNAMNVEVVRFDLRGAGRSGGRRQWVNSFNDYVTDTTSVFNWICSELPDLPLFVLGHSLGGTIAVHFAMIYSATLKGLILSAPAHLLGSNTPQVKIMLGKLLAGALPTFRLPRQSDQSALSRDPEVVAAYLKDPLSSPFNTLRQGSEILRAFADLQNKMQGTRAPLIIFHGSHDRVVKLEGSFNLVQASPSSDKTFHILPGGYHEPHNDLDKQTYFQLLGQWLLPRIAEKKRASLSNTTTRKLKKRASPQSAESH